MCVRDPWPDTVVVVVSNGPYRGGAKKDDEEERIEGETENGTRRLDRRTLGWDRERRNTASSSSAIEASAGRLGLLLSMALIKSDSIYVCLAYLYYWAS